MKSDRLASMIATAAVMVVFSPAGCTTDSAVPPPRDTTENSAPATALAEPGAKATEKAKPRVLQPADLVYKGSFALPRRVNGISTCYTSIGLAMRMVDGRPQFFAGAGPDDSYVYEIDFPGLAVLSADSKACPQANIIKAWGDIWQGKCTLPEKTAIRKHGLYWDEGLHRLYWTFACIYPATGANHPCFGWTELHGAKTSVHGPFRVVGGAVRSDDKSTRAVSSSCHGGFTRIPEWFAKKYTKGRTLGMGFGGYSSIISSGVSMGPALFAVKDPQDATRDYPATPCVAHTCTNGPAGLHYCKRSADYFGDNDWAAPKPVKGVGLWTAMDTIGCAGCWIDLPDVSGMLFMAHMATGKVNYQVMNRREKGGDAHNWVYIYSPTELAAVATGKKTPWTAEPAVRTKFLTPLGGKINGLVFDAPSRTLYVLATHVFQGDYESYPAIHAYEVKKN
jgi:hypothetical protein